MYQTGNQGSRKIDEPAIYEIQIQGHLDRSWSDWLEEMTITYEGDRTILTGRMTDQASLRGVLGKVFDLNQTLISVKRGAEKC